MRRLLEPRVLRLAVGTVLVGAAALLVALDGGTGGSDFLAFTQDIGIDGIVDDGDLGVVRADVPAAQAKTLVPASERGAVLDSRLLRPHSAGELVAWASLAPVAEASGYTVSIPAASFAGALRAGDVVDVVAAGDGHPAGVVAFGVEVTDVRTVAGPAAAGAEDLLLVGLDAPRDVLLAIEDARSVASLRLLRGEGGPR